MIQHSIISSLLRAKTYQLANQPTFDLLLPLLALLATLNPQSRRMVNKNQRLNHSIPTDNTTPPTNDTTPPTVNTAIRAKSALYAANLDVGLRTIQRTKGTKKYVNISPILRAVTAILTMTTITKGIPLQQGLELLTSTST